MEDIDGSFIENCIKTEISYSQSFSEPFRKYLETIDIHRPSTSKVIAPYQNEIEEENIFLDLFTKTKESLPYCELSSFINEEKYENIEYFNAYIRSQETPVDPDILQPIRNDDEIETLLSLLDSIHNTENELENDDIKTDEFNIDQSQENYKNNNYLTDRSDVGFHEEENNINENINTIDQNVLDMIIDHEEIIENSNLSYDENNLEQFDNNYNEYSTNNNIDDNLQNIQIQNDHVEYIMPNNYEDNNLIEMQTSSIQQQQMQQNQIQQSQQEQQKIELESPATLETVNANAENLNSTEDNNNICNQIFVEDFNETDVLVPRTNESSSNHLKTTDTNFKINNAKTIVNIHDYKIIRCNPLKTKLDYKLKDTTVKSKKIEINDNTNQENNKNLLNDSSSNTIDNSISVSFSKKNKLKTNSRKIVDAETSAQFKNKLPSILKLSSPMRNNKNSNTNTTITGGRKNKEKSIINYTIGGNKKNFDNNEMKNSNEKLPIDVITSDNIDYNIEKYLNYILQAPIFETDHDKNSTATNIDRTNNMNTTEYMSLNSSVSSYNSVVTNEISKQDQMLPETEMNINSKIQKICSKNFENRNTMTKLTENVQSLTPYQSVNNKNNSLVTSKISNTFSDDDDDDDDDDVNVKNGKTRCEKCKKVFINPKFLKIHNKRVCILPRTIEKKSSSTNNSLSFNNNDSNLNSPSAIDENIFENSQKSSKSFKSIEKAPSQIIDENIFERSKTVVVMIPYQVIDKYESDDTDIFDMTSFEQNLKFPVKIFNSNNKQFPVKISSNNNTPLKIIDENIQKNKENHAKIMNENNQNFENFSHLPISKINQHNLYQSTPIKISNQQNKNICLPNVSEFRKNHYNQNKNTNDNNNIKKKDILIPKITLSEPFEPSSSNSARTSIAVAVHTDTDIDNVQSNTTSVNNNNSISPVNKIAKKARKRRIKELESLGNHIINVPNDTGCQRVTRSQMKKKNCN